MTEDRELTEFFAEASAQEDGPPLPAMGQREEIEALSRRKFLTGAVAGGAAGLVVASGTGVAVWQVAAAEARADKEAAEAERDGIKVQAAAEMERLQGLVDLYENLEKVGLDAILQTGMVAVALPLAAVELGAKALKQGLEWAEEALLSLGESLPTARESLLWLEEQIASLADGISRLETAIGEALDRATDNAIGEALKDLSAWILDHLPFGLGDRIRDVLEGLVNLITSVDDLLQGVNSHLLEPMRVRWFSEEEGEGLSASLVNPLVAHILDPLEAHLGDLAVLADTWQAELMAPTQQALTQRDQIREQIARYKEEHSLG